VSTVTTTDMATTVCRALMREMGDKPLRLSLFDLRTMSYSYERTNAARIADQWTVTLMPTLEFVTVSAHGKYWGMGMHDDLDIGGSKRPQYHYVRYPDGDPTLIAGAEYVTALRAAVEQALAAVERDHAKAHGGVAGAVREQQPGRDETAQALGQLAQDLAALHRQGRIGGLL
jgi:hypothetical protein